MKKGEFRRWVTELWYENCKEREAWGDSKGCENSTEYFLKYKYWLKREFKHQNEKNFQKS